MLTLLYLYHTFRDISNIIMLLRVCEISLIGSLNKKNLKKIRNSVQRNVQ